MEVDMNIRWLLAVMLAFVSAGSARAQAPWQFRWEKGQSLVYRVKHITNVAEVVEGAKVESASNLSLVKRWTVAEVDQQGVATLQLTILAMRNEQKRPNGETLVYDSVNLDKSTPELRESMSKFINKTLVTLRVNAAGMVLDAKGSSLAKYEAEPPFALVLPNAALKEGQSWVRPYAITLEPPQGAGEKHQAEQKYARTKLEQGLATVTLGTSLKAVPEAMHERLPLLQKEVMGTITFDVQAGRVTAMRLNIDRTIENHMGKGSSYRFLSEYSEDLEVSPR
jgi:hypothetical protein